MYDTFKVRAEREINEPQLLEMGKFMYVWQSTIWGLSDFSVRLETKQRGSRYWVMYKRRDGKLKKAYVCPETELSHEKLQAAATKCGHV